MRRREPLIRRRLEQVVAWMTLLTSLVGVAERVNHYAKLAQKKYRSKKHPLGFRP